MSNSSLNSAPSSYPLLSGVPLAVTQANLSIIGNKGNSTYTYFVIANYPGGQVVSKGFVINNAPDTVDTNNYIRLNFTSVPNATSYDLLRLTGIYQSLPASVTNATLTTSTTSTSYNNQSAPGGGSYTPTLIGSSQIDLAIENQSTAYSRVYFNPVTSGPFELDLSIFSQILGNFIAVLVYITQNTAPSDASLQNGWAALWFDPTNGAPSLNVKAKQLDGTIVNATILLS